MYEDYYASIPDIDAYLDRIGMKRPVEPDLKTLNEIVYAHQCKVPFENIDIYAFKKEVSLSIPDLFDKVVTRKRGGYCFELNGLFTQFLKDLGYNAWSLMVRIVRGRDFLGPIMHRGVMVEIDRKRYFCDVGFGGPAPGGAVLVQDQSITQCAGVDYLIQRLDEYWWLLSALDENGQPQKLFRFYDMPQENIDYITLSHYCSGPESNFAKRWFLNLRLPDGSCSVMQDEFTITHGDRKEIRTIASDQEFWTIAKTYFGLEL